MAEQGVAGLSVGEIARRMGIRPPSLYGYFPSKHALYDALFERGARAVLTEMEVQVAPYAAEERSVERILVRAAEAFVRWTVANPAYTQLLYWRPVPGFAPSPQAYAPALRLAQLDRELFAQLQARGLLTDRVSSDQLHRDWTVLVAGVVSQQLSNAPEESFDEGTYTSAIPELIRMFIGHYKANGAPSGGKHSD